MKISIILTLNCFTFLKGSSYHPSHVIHGKFCSSHKSIWALGIGCSTYRLEWDNYATRNARCTFPVPELRPTAQSSARSMLQRFFRRVRRKLPEHSEMNDNMKIANTSKFWYITQISYTSLPLNNENRFQRYYQLSLFHMIIWYQGRKYTKTGYIKRTLPKTKPLSKKSNPQSSSHTPPKT